MASDEEIIEEVDELKQISPVIRLFESVAFERGQDLHNQVATMIQLFSSSDVTLDMVDTLIDCVKIVFVHQHAHRSERTLEFLATLAHVAHSNYASNNNLALVFDALIDIITQTLSAVDSQIRHCTFRFLNKLQSLIDLSRSFWVSDQFDRLLLDLLDSETTLLVLDEIIPFAAQFQHKNSQFTDALIRRINSSKWIPYLDRRRQAMLLLECCPSSLIFLTKILETDGDLSQLAFESLLTDSRGFTLNTLDLRSRLALLKVAASSRDLSRLVFTRWISQSNRELIDILRLCEVSTWAVDKTNKNCSPIEMALRYFLDDENIRRIVIDNTKKATGKSKGGVLLSNTSDYVERLFIWRILCQLMGEEEGNERNIHPDFHEFIAYFYRLIKSSVIGSISINLEFIISQHAFILATFDTLDVYRRKCIEAMGRCMLVHFGQCETIVRQAFHLIHLVHTSTDTFNERCQLITYTLNDIIQRCQTIDQEEITFIQCMTTARIFLEYEQQSELDLKNTDFKQLIDTLIKSGLSNGELHIRSQSMAALRALMCHSRQEAIAHIKQIITITKKSEHIQLRCESLRTFFDSLLVHGLDILSTVNASQSASFSSLSQLTTQYLLSLVAERNIEMKSVIVSGLIKLFLSSRLEPTLELLRILLDYRFSNDSSTIKQQERDELNMFFYFFMHLSPSNVSLIEELTFELASRILPLVSETSSASAYKTVLIEPMCHFCIELLSLSTLPVAITSNEDNEEIHHPHFRLAQYLLDSIHNLANNRSSLIVKSYLNTIKHVEFQYMTKEELEHIFDLVIRIRQYPNFPSIVLTLIKNIEERIQSSLKLINKLTNSNNENKRQRSPSPSIPISAKRISHGSSSSFDPPITSSPLRSSALRDRTNQTLLNSNSGLSKGTKRKLNSLRYSTLDFENDSEDFF